MAWTRSAQLRGNYAGFSAAIDAISSYRSFCQSCFLAAAPRSRYVAVAAALTVSGIWFPAVSADDLSTALFVAGAGVAAFAMRPSLTPRPVQLQSQGAQRSPAARFEELVDRPNASAIHDREAWARLTAHMSHELRTPLNAVLGFSELMSNEVFGPMGSRFYSDYARDIHASGRMLLKSAEDALAITALLTACPDGRRDASSSLSHCVSDALAFHANAFGDGERRLTTDFAGEDLILADAQTVRQLFVNVVAEALERGARGSSCHVSTRFTGAQMRCVITVDCAAPAGGGDSFNLQLARTLSDLSGGRIQETNSNGALELAVSFSPSVQRDFFAES